VTKAVEQEKSEMVILHAMPRKSALVSGSALALVLLASPATSFEPHGAPPPVTTPPQQPPRVYAPPVLPPESQAIPSRKPSATAPKPTSPSQPAAAPQKSADQIAREKAAADAKVKARETGRELQRLLGELGHDPGPVDGIVGRKTMDAVFGWIAGIEDPDVQQEARVAAHNSDYEALADFLYIQTINPDVGGTSTGVQSPAPVKPEAQTVEKPANRAPGAEMGGEPQPEQSVDVGEDEKMPDTASKQTEETDEARFDVGQRVDEYRSFVEQVLSTGVDEGAFATVNGAYSRTYSAIEAAFKAEMRANGWESVPFGATFMNFYQQALEDPEISDELTEELTRKIAEGKAYLALAEKYQSMLNAVAKAHNDATTQIRERLLAKASVPEIPDAPAAGEVFDDPEVVEILTAEAERQEAISQSQQDMDTFLSNRAQAEAELKSLNDRADLSAEQKARIAKDINARLAFNDTLLREAQTKLAAQGASFDGYDGKDMTEFDPYAINQTDIELTRIAQEAEATDRFYDEIRLARETIRDTADGLDAITLQERVTDISERLAGNAEDINKLAEQVHDYSVNIRVTREQGELEHLSALADLAVIDAEENLAYTRSVVTTSKNANLLLALGAGAGSALGIGGVTAAEVASAQAVMAAMDGTTGAIEGFDNGGFGEALKQGAAESGKYYLPINTVMALDRGDDKTGLALSVLSDAAVLFTGYKTARTHLDKARAAKAAVTRQTLGASEKAVSDAARRAVDKADDLIANYQKAKWTAQQARATGMVDEVAETTLQRAVKAIDRSDEAKLALKARDSKLQYLFVRDQTKIVKAPASAAWEKNMRDLGWSDTALRTEQIRNRSSAGTVGLDDDIRLLEPSLLDTLDDGVTPRYSGSNDPTLLKARADFRKSLTRRGETASLAQWEQDAKTAMEKAYRETAGYAASDARVNMTTSVNPEAYSDIGLLTGDGGSAGWAEQTASVTQTKIRDGVDAAEAMGLGSSNPNTSLSGTALEAAATETKVASRELLKDLAGKAMRTRPDVALPRKVERQLSILDGLSRGILDPAVANRQLINETGTTLAKTMETLGGQVEVLLKLN